MIFPLQNFVRSLVFKLQEEIVSISLVAYRRRAGAVLTVKRGCFTHGAHMCYVQQAAFLIMTAMNMSADQRLSDA